MPQRQRRCRPRRRPLEQLGPQLLGEEIVGLALVDEHLRHARAVLDQRDRVVPAPGGAVGAEIARRAPSRPRAPALGATIGAKAETLRKRPGLRSARVSAPWPPIEWPVIACRAMSAGKCAGDQRRQLLGDVGVHAVIGRPRRLGRVDVEAGALAEIIGLVVGHVLAARAGVGRDEDQAELGAGARDTRPSR